MLGVFLHRPCGPGFRMSQPKLPRSVFAEASEPGRGVLTSTAMPRGSGRSGNCSRGIAGRGVAVGKNAGSHDFNARAIEFIQHIGPEAGVDFVHQIRLVAPGAQLIGDRIVAQFCLPHAWSRIRKNVLGPVGALYHEAVDSAPVDVVPDPRVHGKHKSLRSGKGCVVRMDVDRMALLGIVTDSFWRVTMRVTKRLLSRTKPMVSPMRTKSRAGKRRYRSA